MPLAIARLERLMIFIVLSERNRYIKLMRSEKGMVSAIITLGANCLRKNHTTSTTRSTASHTLDFKEWRAFIISLEVSKITTISTSAGNVFLMASSFFLTVSATSTVFVPDCFWTIIMMPGFLFTLTIESTSLNPSSTLAISLI